MTCPRVTRCRILALLQINHLEEEVPCVSYPFYSTLLIGIKIGECIWHLSRIYPSPTNVDRGLDIVLFSSVKREGLIVEKKKVALIQGQLVLMMWPSTHRSSSSVVEPRPTDFELYVKAFVEWPTSHGLFREICYTFFESCPSFNPKKVAF